MTHVIFLTDAEVADSPIVDNPERRKTKTHCAPDQTGYAISQIPRCHNPIQTEPNHTNRKQCVPITTSEDTPQTPTLREHKHKHEHEHKQSDTQPDTPHNSRRPRRAMCLNYTRLPGPDPGLRLHQSRAWNPYTQRRPRKQLYSRCLVAARRLLDNGRR